MLGDKIKQFRIDNYYSQSDMARALGVNIRTIARWEQNKNRPNLNELKKIAELIGTSVEELCASDAENKEDHSEVTTINALDKISDSVDNLVTGQETLNEAIYISRNENSQRQNEIIDRLKIQNAELLKKLDEQYELVSSYKEAFEVSKEESRHRRIRTIAIVITCIIILCTLILTWLYWMNHGYKNMGDGLEGSVEINTPTSFVIDD